MDDVECFKDLIRGYITMNSNKNYSDYRFQNRQIVKYECPQPSESAHWFCCDSDHEHDEGELYSDEEEVFDNLVVNSISEIYSEEESNYTFECFNYKTKEKHKIIFTPSDECIYYCVKKN